MEAVQYGVTEGVGTITLNRPEAKNALNLRMRTEIDELVNAVQRDPSVRALILTGAGGVFCAGGDIQEMRAEPRPSPEALHARLQDAHRLVKSLLELNRPLIAAVDGPAYGAGFSLALTADFVLASPRARFCMAFQRLGLIPDLGALYTLPRVVGLQRAKEILFSARELGAEEAARMGLVLEITPGDELMRRAQELAECLAGASATAISLTKHALNASLQSDLSTMLGLEAAGQAIAARSEYAQDAVRRFAEKLPARFRWSAPQSKESNLMRGSEQ